MPVNTARKYNINFSSARISIFIKKKIVLIIYKIVAKSLSLVTLSYSSHIRPGNLITANRRVLISNRGEAASQLSRERQRGVWNSWVTVASSEEFPRGRRLGETSSSCGEQKSQGASTKPVFLVRGHSLSVREEAW